MLEVRNISIKKITEDRELIRNLSFILNKNDKYAIVGLEGSGKSTLLKVINGYGNLDYIETTGIVQKDRVRLGYLPQSIKEDWYEYNIIDYLLKKDKNTDIDFDDYSLLSMLDKTLNYVKFDTTIFDDSKKVGEYSGGEVVKLGLVKLLIREPNVLLLDEPTNDLDLETILFLEEFIKNEVRPILFISHDEALLENTANGIIHLVQTHKKTKAVSIFEKSSYTDYKQKRKLRLDSEEMVAKKQRSDFKKKMERYRQIFQKVEHLQNQKVRNPSAARLLAKKVKSLKSTEKRYQKEQENFTSIPEREEEINIFFSEKVKIPNNKTVIEYYKEALEVEGRVLSQGISLTVKGPEKIAIIGKNGSGKTTLLKDIYSKLKTRKDIKVGYMSQDYDEQLCGSKIALDILLDEPDKKKEAKVRKIMGALHFTREEMLYNQTDLSGGQKAKLLLLKMVLDDANVLILDEPTRNLSPLSIPVIHDLLLKYKGAIISVTHDRNFIENVFDVVYVLDQDTLKKL